MNNKFVRRERGEGVASVPHHEEGLRIGVVVWMDIFEPFLGTVYEFSRQPEVILFPDNFCEGDSFADGIENVEHMFL